MDDLRLQADFFFGPCNDPECPGERTASGEPRLEHMWPIHEQRGLIEDD